jgi:hypothetical protein
MCRQTCLSLSRVVSKIGKTLGIGTGTVQSVLIEQPSPFEAGARSRPLPQSNGCPPAPVGNRVALKL